MIPAPVAPAARGRTQISTRALTRVVTAVAAEALGLRPDQVTVDLTGAAGRLDITVRVPQRTVQLEMNSTAPDADKTVLARSEHVQDDIREAVSALTGAQVASVTVSVTSSRIRRPPQPPPREREKTMSASDKMKNAAEDLKGKAKEAAGKATNDDSKVAEGKTDQASAKVKKAGEDVKDAFK